MRLKLTVPLDSKEELDDMLQKGDALSESMDIQGSNLVVVAQVRALVSLCRTPFAHTDTRTHARTTWCSAWHSLAAECFNYES